MISLYAVAMQMAASFANKGNRPNIIVASATHYFFSYSYTEQLARTYKIPMVRLVDGSSGGGSVATILDMQATYVPPLFGFDHQVAY